MFLARGGGRRLGLVLVCAVALAGCGRKGPLTLPNAPQSPSQATASAAQQDRVLPPVDDPGLIQPPSTPRAQLSPAEKLKAQAAAPQPPINGPQPPANKPFVLDPLL